MRNLIRTKAFVTGLAMAVLALPRAGWAAETEIEELKREVRALQSQMQALRAAIAEAAELGRASCRERVFRVV